MQPEEILVYAPKDFATFESSVKISVLRTLISLCFFDNVYNEDLAEEKIFQTIRNRICLKIFELFAKENQLEIAFQHSHFPYWKTGNFDFSFRNSAWDFMVNSIQGDNLAETEILKLPALVPNRSEVDNWSRRLHVPEKHKSRRFLFAFIREDQWKAFRHSVDEMLTRQRLSFLKKTAYENLGWNINQQSFNENEFWTNFEMDSRIPDFTFQAIPDLIICAVAGKKEFPFFADTDSISAHGYSLFTGKYYEYIEGGGLSFLNNRIQTKFRNATCPIRILPSFQSML